MTQEQSIGFPGAVSREVSSPALVVRYGSAYVLLFTIGLVGYYLLKVPFSEKLNGCINTYFTSMFDGTGGAGGNLARLFAASIGDLRTLILLFLGGFTMFSSLAIYGLLGFHALSLGFSAAYLVGALSVGELAGVRFPDLVLYLFGRAAICAILILFSSGTRLFCDNFRRLGADPRRILRFRGLYRQIFSLLCTGGGILAIHCLRFLMNALFLKR